MRRYLRLILPFVLLVPGLGRVAAQGMPTTQPNRLSIFIEHIKPGMDDDHTANEAGWPAAFAKTNDPNYYLALSSMTGSSEVWFISAWDSYAAEGESMKLVNDDPALSAELSRLWKADGQYLTEAEGIEAMARPDLSYGAFPDLGLARFFEVTMFRIRGGHEAGFEAAAKLYRDHFKQSIPNGSYRVYQVNEGMPGTNFLIFSSVNSYAALDTMHAADEKLWSSMSAKDQAVFTKFSQEDLQFAVSNRFRVSPGMSYVSPETKAKDPNFWK